MPVNFDVDVFGIEAEQGVAHGAASDQSAIARGMKVAHDAPERGREVEHLTARN